VIEGGELLCLFGEFLGFLGALGLECGEVGEALFDFGVGGFAVEGLAEHLTDAEFVRAVFGGMNDRFCPTLGPVDDEGGIEEGERLGGDVGGVAIASGGEGDGGVEGGEEGVEGVADDFEVDAAAWNG